MPRVRIELDPARVEELAATGASLESIAAVLGCSETTLRTRRNEDAEIAAAVKKGRARAETEYATALKEIAIQKDESGRYVYETKYRLKALTFFLERRAGWKGEGIHLEGGDKSLTLSWSDKAEEI